MLKRLSALFPSFAKGEVVKGFGRGSKQLGIPTANYPDSFVDKLPKDFESGVYYGWANVSDGLVHKMVMSVGWNPFYKNTKRTMETHILHTFENDFYGSMLKLCILGYIRPEKDFSSVDDLIVAIQEDIKEAQEQLDKPELKVFREAEFFKFTLNHHL